MPVPPLPLAIATRPSLPPYQRQDVADAEIDAGAAAAAQAIVYQQPVTCADRPCGTRRLAGTAKQAVVRGAHYGEHLAPRRRPRRRAPPAPAPHHVGSGPVPLPVARHRCAHRAASPSTIANVSRTLRSSSTSA